jgi:hypothetical protein
MRCVTLGIYHHHLYLVRRTRLSSVRPLERERDWTTGEKGMNESSIMGSFALERILKKL